MTRELEHAHQAVADHARAQVADVHFFGDVGAAVIDHHGVGLRRAADTQPRVAQGLGQQAIEVFVLQRDVDEARTGDLQLFADVVGLQRGEQRLRHVARRALEALAQAHGKVCLKIRAVGPAHERIDPGVLGAKCAGNSLLEALGQLQLR